MNIVGSVEDVMCIRMMEDCYTIVLHVIYVLKDMIITVYGQENVLEKETYNNSIFSCAGHLLH